MLPGFWIGKIGLGVLSIIYALWLTTVVFGFEKESVGFRLPPLHLLALKMAQIC